MKTIGIVALFLALASPACADFFQPNPDLTRTLSLGTKGFRNFSTLSQTANVLKRDAIKFVCVTTGTSTAAPVQVSIVQPFTTAQNNLSAVMSTGEFLVRHNAPLIKFQAFSSQSGTSCTVFAQSH